MQRSYEHATLAAERTVETTSEQTRGLDESIDRRALIAMLQENLAGTGKHLIIIEASLATNARQDSII